MNLLKYGFKISGEYLYDIKPTITRKIKKEVQEEAKKYEEMLNELKIPIDLFVYRLDEIMYEDLPESIAPEAIPTFTRHPKAQQILNNLNTIQAGWNAAKARYSNQQGFFRFMSNKTYKRHMGHYRNELTKMMKMPNLLPLDDRDLTYTYATTGGILDDIQEQKQNLSIF